jgi:hypothetical protein
MQSLSKVISTASDRRQMPPYTAGSSRDLGLKLGLAVPFTLSSLIANLDGLPLLSVVFKSGTRGPSTTTGWANVGIQSDGLSGFRGYVREDGVVGHNYLFVMAFPDLRDAKGRPVVFAHEGKVHGRDELGLGDRSDSWNEGGPLDPVQQNLFVDNWDALRTARFESKLHVSTDPIEATLFVGEFLVAIGVVIAGAVGFVLCASNLECETPKWKIFPGTEAHPGIDFGVEVICKFK